MSDDDKMHDSLLVLNRRRKIRDLAVAEFYKRTHTTTAMGRRLEERRKKAPSEVMVDELSYKIENFLKTVKLGSEVDVQWPDPKPIKHVRHAIVEVLKEIGHEMINSDLNSNKYPDVKYEILKKLGRV